MESSVTIIKHVMPYFFDRLEKIQVFMARPPQLMAYMILVNNEVYHLKR